MCGCDVRLRCEAALSDASVYMHALCMRTLSCMLDACVAALQGCPVRCICVYACIVYAHPLMHARRVCGCTARLPRPMHLCICMHRVCAPSHACSTRVWLHCEAAPSEACVCMHALCMHTPFHACAAQVLREGLPMHAFLPLG